jgi:hypothetical protein
MKWLIIFLVCIALLIAALAVVGSVLPREHTASRKARFKQPMEAVFPIITDFVSMPTWRAGVDSVEMLPSRDEKPSFREKGPQGAIAYVIDERDAPKKLVTRIVDNRAFGGTWTFELTPIPTGCQLAITERGEVYNPIFRVMSHFFFSPTASMEGYLQDLGKKMGENVVPEA